MDLPTLMSELRTQLVARDKRKIDWPMLIQPRHLEQLLNAIDQLQGKRQQDDG